MLIPFGVIGGAAGGAAGSFELISTTVLSTATATINLTSIPSSYKHLELRYVARSSNSGGTTRLVALQFNTDTGSSNYSFHNLGGNGSTVSSGSASDQAYIPGGYYVGSTGTASAFGAGIVSILDYASTSKFKTVRSLNGIAQAGTFVYMHSGNWRSTEAISTIVIKDMAGFTFDAGSRFSIYGIKG